MRIIFRLLIISILIFILFGVVNANAELKFNKPPGPFFEFNNEPLVNNIDVSFILHNTLYSKPIGNISDENIILIYQFYSRKMYSGTELFNFSIQNMKIYDYSSREWYIVNGSYFRDLGLNETDFLPGTELEGLNSYFNSESIQSEFFLDYEILNSDISKFSPFIFNLGKWPNAINNNTIDDYLGKKIENRTLLIFGF